MDASTIEVGLENLHKEIYKAADTTIPNNKKQIEGNSKGARPSHVYKTVFWWNKACEKAKKDRKAALRKWAKTKTPEAHQNYKDKRNFATKVITNTQKRAWRAHVQQLSINSDPKKTWNMLKAMDGRVPTQQIKPIQDPHTGQMLTQDEEKANVLADHYEYVSSDKNIDPEYLKSKDKKLNERLSRHKGILDKKDYNTPITLTELEETLRQKAETAPGEDGITYAMLLHLPKEGKIFLLKIFNMIWDKGKIPSSFKEGIIMPF